MQQSTHPSAGKSQAGRGSSFDPAAAKAFGQALRAMRERIGVAQDQLALTANIDRSYYGKLERGERQPSLGLLLRAAKALGVSGATLVEVTESLLKKASDTRQRQGRTPTAKGR